MVRIFSDGPEMVAATAARSLPSTRAGGQDDGSLTNSLKLACHLNPGPISDQI